MSPKSSASDVNWDTDMDMHRQSLQRLLSPRIKVTIPSPSRCGGSPSPMMLDMTTAEATTSTTATTTNTTANATTTDNTTTTTPTPLDTTSSSPSSSSSSSENVTPIEYDLPEPMQTTIFFRNPRKPRLAPTCSPGPVTPLALEPQTTATTMTSALTSTSTTAAAPSASGNDYLTAATPAFREKKLSTTTTNRLLCSLSKHELTGLSKSQLEPTLSRRVSKDDSVINESKSKGNRSRAKSMEQAN